MPTSTHLDNLKINVLTESQFDAAVQGGVIGANEISILTDVDEAIQVDTMPAAAAGEVGKVYQFIGTTDANYTHGYFYECVSDGGNPAAYSWVQTNVQPAPSGLPSQTGNSGKFLTTDGTDASWSDKPLVNTANLPAQQVGILGTVATSSDAYGIAIGSGAMQLGRNRSIAIGCNSKAGTGSGTTSNVAIGNAAEATGGNFGFAIAIGSLAKATETGAIQIGDGTNSTIGTLCVGLRTFSSITNNYRLLDSDGTIPTDRFATTPSADGTYVPTLTISSGVATRSWAAPAGGASSATGTLAAASWSSSSQTINVTGVTASNNVIVAAAPASQADYTAAGVICTAQGAGTLTFTCTSTPSTDLTVNVLII